MRIRQATEDDLEATAAIFVASCGDLIERFHPQDRHLLPLNPDDRMSMHRHLFDTGTVLIAEDEEPLGFSCSIVREDLWFLSQLWVMPGRQGAGIGAALLDRALADGEGASAFAVASSVDPTARTLYLRRLMFPMWELVELEGRGGGDPLVETRPLTEDDQPWINEVDRGTFGAAHPQDHAWFRSLGGGWSLRRDGHPVGYIYVAPRLMGGDAIHMGPGAVTSAADVGTLVGTGLALAGDAPVEIHVPSANWAAVNELVRRGFRWGDASLFLASRPFGDPSRYISAGGALG